MEAKLARMQELIEAMYGEIMQIRDLNTENKVNYSGAIHGLTRDAEGDLNQLNRLVIELRLG